MLQLKCPKGHYILICNVIYALYRCVSDMITVSYNTIYFRRKKQRIRFFLKRKPLQYVKAPEIKT